MYTVRWYIVHYIEGSVFLWDDLKTKTKKVKYSSFGRKKNRFSVWLEVTIFDEPTYFSEHFPNFKWFDLDIDTTKIE